jgi:serine protease Do
VGIGFAISANLAKEIVGDLIDDGKVERGWLGVQIQGLDEDLAASLGLPRPEGALVSRVEPDSPAEKAGVVRGDVILAFGDQRIDRVTRLSRAVAATAAGSEQRITVWRDGREQVLESTVEPMPGEQQMAASRGAEEGAGQPRLGLSLAPLTAEARARLGLDAKVRGVLVAQVMPGGPAAEKGLQAGDLIVSVDNRQVDQPQEVIEAVQSAEQEGKRAVLMLVLRDGQELFQAIPFANS